MFLPSSYDQFLQHRKKAAKPAYQKPASSAHELQKENKIGNTTEKDDFNEEEISEKEQIRKPSVLIVEKVVHSDYKKMFDDFNNSKFDSIKNKIAN